MKNKRPGVLDMGGRLENLVKGMGQASEDLSQKEPSETKSTNKTTKTSLRAKSKVFHSSELDAIAQENTLKLAVSGRLRKTEFSYVNKNLFLLENLSKEIKTYCGGGDLSVLNYLLHLGLSQVKNSDTMSMVDLGDLEKLYK
jgi:hypothetical protein